MAKNDKLGKLLLGSALAGAAIGTLTYFLKKKGQDSSWDDEDLEDFDDNLTDHKTEDDEDDDTSAESRTTPTGVGTETEDYYDTDYEVYTGRNAASACGSAVTV